MNHKNMNITCTRCGSEIVHGRSGVFCNCLINANQAAISQLGKVKTPVTNEDLSAQLDRIERKLDELKEGR